MKNSYNQKMIFIAVLSVILIFTVPACLYVAVEKVEAEKIENNKVNYQKPEKMNTSAIKISEASAQVEKENCYNLSLIFWYMCRLDF